MVSFKPSPVKVTLTGELRINAEVPQAATAPGGLYPMRAKAFAMDEYRIMNGWPVAVPPHDIHATSMFSASGARFTTRVSPMEVETEATVRWIPDEDYYDSTSLLWFPYVDLTSGSRWQSSSQVMPTLITDYTYRLGSEVFEHKALNFDSDGRKHLWADFNTFIGGSAGYTVIMVFCPSSAYGNNEAVPYNGIWGPGRPSPGTQTFSEPLPAHYPMVTMSGGDLYYQDEAKERTRALSIPTNTNTPVYLAMVFSRPEVTFYAGTGSTGLRVKTLPAGSQDSVPLNGHVVLGRTPGDILHTADMALLDLSVYGDALNATDVQKEFSMLAQAYGGVAQ